MKTPISILALVMTSISAYADSDTPVCQGNAVPASLQGSWIDSEDDSSITLTANTLISFDEEFDKDVEVKAWHCKKNGMSFLVLDFGTEATDGRYESRMLASFELKGDKYLLDLGEAYFVSKDGSEQIVLNPYNSDEKATLVKKR